jgi:hypothetical protein
VLLQSLNVLTVCRLLLASTVLDIVCCLSTARWSHNTCMYRAVSLACSLDVVVNCIMVQHDTYQAAGICQWDAQAAL